MIFKSETMKRRAFASFLVLQTPGFSIFNNGAPLPKCPEARGFRLHFEKWAKGEKEKLIFSHNLLLFPPL